MEWRSDTRGVSTLTEIFIWGIIGLVVLGVVLTLVSMVVSIATSILLALVPIFLLGAIIYLAIKYATDDGSTDPTSGFDFGTNTSAETAGTAASQDPQDRLTEQYIRGEISEAEYERRIEQYVDTPGGRRTSTGAGRTDTGEEFDADPSREREFDR